MELDDVGFEEEQRHIEARLLEQEKDARRCLKMFSGISLIPAIGLVFCSMYGAQYVWSTALSVCCFFCGALGGLYLFASTLSCIGAFRGSMMILLWVCVA